MCAASSFTLEKQVDATTLEAIGKVLGRAVAPPDGAQLRAMEPPVDEWREWLEDGGP